MSLVRSEHDTGRVCAGARWGCDEIDKVVFVLSTCMSPPSYAALPKIPGSLGAQRRGLSTTARTVGRCAGWAESQPLLRGYSRSILPRLGGIEFQAYCMPDLKSAVRDLRKGDPFRDPDLSRRPRGR